MNGMENIFINTNICQKQLPFVQRSVIATVTRAAPSHKLMKQENRNPAKVTARRALLNLLGRDREMSHARFYFVLPFNAAVPPGEDKN